MCVAYGAQNIITKLTVNQRVQRFKAEQTSMSGKPQSDRLSKRSTGMPQASMGDSLKSVKSREK